MPPKTPWEDEYTLLCERCGYVIEGLPSDGACPECGKPISESLPERRVGTPWQQWPSLPNLLRTWWMTLRHPKQTLDLMQFDEELSNRQLALTCLAGLILWPVLWVMSQIEASGLVLFGKQRRARITTAAAATICAHGAVGWVVSMLGLGFGLLGAGWALERVVGAGFDHHYLDGPDPGPQHFEQAVLWIAAACGTLLLLAGFLFFEWFAWLGLRRCKYANRTRPEDRPSKADPAPQ